MAAPVVAGRASGAQTSTVTSHPVTLPSGIVAGDLLVVVFAFSGTGNDFPSTPPTGWQQTASASSGCATMVFWRFATGDTKDTMTLTTGLGLRSAHLSYRITGAGALVLRS